MARGSCYDGVCLPSGCGNGILDRGEVCDDGNRIAADGCSLDCRSNETCGNGVVDSVMGESCEPNGSTTDPWCRDTCVSVRCGDGVVDVSALERCDEGAGNSLTPDATCRPNCQPRRCGDGVTDDGEVCDDGNQLNDDGCSADCRSRETCGNGIVDAAAGETCDTADAATGRWCRADCVSIRCGDGVLDADQLEECDEGAANSDAPDAHCRPNCQPQRCGDGITDARETCDDGNSLVGDGCSAGCRSDETCGNGIVDTAVGESCEPTLVTFGPWCRADCVTVRCGDGIVDRNLFELCDEGEANADTPDAACRPNCQPRRCGDGVVDGDEVCDDGNSRNGDGCAYDCRSREECRNGIVDLARGEECDDGNALSHDGCSSGCRRELPTFRNLLPDDPLYPDSYEGRRSSYDVARDRLVMYDAPHTWEFERSGWLVAPRRGRSPEAQRDYGLAWSAACRCTVLFGGEDARGLPLSATWQWDGSTWTERLGLATTPSARRAPAMAYDPRRRRIVLFGGVGERPQDDTWEWDGTTWREVPTADAPPAGTHLMTYDPVRALMALFDGTTLWSYDGRSWRRLSSGPGPDLSGLTSPQLTFDRARSALALRALSFEPSFEVATVSTWLFDGSRLAPAEPGVPLENVWLDHPALHALPSDGRILVGGDGALWILDGATWTAPMIQGRRLDPISGGALAYDALRGDIVHVGGYEVVDGAEVPLPDTHVWDGASWHRLRLDPAPPMRASTSLTFDGARGRLTMFGGAALGRPGELGDTWTWDGSRWSEDHPARAPSPRAGAAIAYDPVARRVLMFGGDVLGADAPLDETWQWQDGVWSELELEHRPPARHTHGMVFDPVASRMVVWGGFLGNTSTGDTRMWEFDGARWSARPSANEPTLLIPALVYDASQGATMLLEGLASSSDFARTHYWTWRHAAPSANEGAFQEWTSVEGLPEVFDRCLAYDAVHQRVIAIARGSNYYSDTWEFALRSSEVDEACRGGFDVDGDHLIGCDDPDCWGVCRPLCPPGAPCDGTYPRCGDGLCNGLLETPRVCPIDCPVAPVCGDLFCDPGENVGTCPGECS